MMKILAALLLGLAVNVEATCTPQSGGMGLGLTSYGDSASSFLTCTNNNFIAINGVATSTTNLNNVKASTGTCASGYAAQVLGNGSVTCTSTISNANAVPASGVLSGTLGNGVNLATVPGLTAQTYGSASAVMSCAVTSSGTLSNCANTSISIPGSSVTSGVAESVNASMVGTGASGSALGVSASSVAVLNASGFVLNSQIDSSSVTKQGNAFNGANQLMQLNGQSSISITGSITASSATILGGIGAAGSITMSGTNSVLTSSGIATTAGNVGLFISTNVYMPVTSTMTAGYFIGNGAGLKNLPAGVEVTNGSMIGNGTSGSALAVNPASGTLQGNVFNGPGQLAQLNSAGNVVLPYGIQAATAVFSNGTFAVVVATGVNGYSVQLSSGLNVAAAGLFYNGMPGTTAALSSNQTLCGGNVNGSIWTGNTPCSASGGQGFTGWYTDSFTSNGSTTQFTLTNTPIYGSQTISLSGMDLISGTDYTISTKTVTFSTAPATGNLLTAFYMY